MTYTADELQVVRRWLYGNAMELLFIVSDPATPKDKYESSRTVLMWITERHDPMVDDLAALTAQASAAVGGGE